MAEHPLRDYELLTDLELFARLQQRDLNAFGELDRRYSTWLLRTLSRTEANGFEPEDIVQETLIHLFEKGNGFDVRVSLRGLLKAIAGQKIIQHHRKRAARKRGGGNVAALNAPDTVAEHRPAPDDQVAADELMKWALNKLSDEERTAICLVYFEGHSNTAAAADLDISINTFNGQLQRARNKLRRILNEGYDPPNRDAS